MVNKTDTDALWRQVKHYPRVVGYCDRLRLRLRNGRERSAWSFRVYVAHKIPESELEPEDIIPETINGIPVDVVDFGEHFRDEIKLSGEFMLIDDAYIGESCFLSAP